MSHHYSGPEFGFPHGDARLGPARSLMLARRTRSDLLNWWSP
jgi:hypothetical protein